MGTGCEALASLFNTSSSTGEHITSSVHAALRGMGRHLQEERVQGFCCDALIILAAAPGGLSAITSMASMETVEQALKAHPKSMILQLVGTKLLDLIREVAT